MTVWANSSIKQNIIRGKTQKKNIRELPIVSQPFPTFFWHFHTFSHLMPIHLGPRHCSKTRLRNASDLSIMLSKPQPILQDIWLWVKTLVPWVPSNSWDVNSPKCIVRVQIFLFFVFFVFQSGALFLAICYILEQKHVLCWISELTFAICTVHRLLKHNRVGSKQWHWMLS